MKTTVLALMLLGCVACSHPTPVAQRPPDPTPVANTTPAPAKTTPVKQNPATTTPPQQVAAAPSKPAAMPQAVRETLKERLAHLEDALFDFDKDTIRPDASTALRDDVNVIRGILADYPSQTLVIEGHADERGSAEYNLALGDRRAQAVRDFLTSMSIPARQLSVISYGKERPVCTEESEECWQRNRRAHVTAAP